MTERTYTSKTGDTWIWEETSEVIESLKELNKFSGNYQGPLYAPHPDLNNGKETN